MHIPDLSAMQLLTMAETSKPYKIVFERKYHKEYSLEEPNGVRTFSSTMNQPFLDSSQTCLPEKAPNLLGPGVLASE